MNLIVACNQNYVHPLRVMLTSFLNSNTFEHHNIYFLYSDVDQESIVRVKHFLERKHLCTFVPIAVHKDDFTDFPVSHHFSIETYYRFLVQDIVPKTESRALWLDVDMIVRKSLKEFYYQNFNNNTLVVCKSINKEPKALLDKLGCPEGSIYFNAGCILFNLEHLRDTTLRDYSLFYEQNKERITWLDQDILNAMYAKKTQFADYRIYNMQMFSDTVFTEAELHFINEHTAIVHYIGGVKPWHSRYSNPCLTYWVEYEKQAYSTKETAISLIRRICVKLSNLVKRK